MKNKKRKINLNIPKKIKKWNKNGVKLKLK